MHKISKYVFRYCIHAYAYIAGSEDASSNELEIILHISWNRSARILSGILFQKDSQESALCTNRHIMRKLKKQCLPAIRCDHPSGLCQVHVDVLWRYILRHEHFAALCGSSIRKRCMLNMCRSDYILAL